MLYDKVPEMDGLGNEVREAHQLCLGARFRHNFLLCEAGIQLPRVTKNDCAAGMRLSAALMHPIGCIDIGAESHLVPNTKYYASVWGYP